MEAVQSLKETTMNASVNDILHVLIAAKAVEVSRTMDWKLNIMARLRLPSYSKLNLRPIYYSKIDRRLIFPKKECNLKIVENKCLLLSLFWYMVTL